MFVISPIRFILKGGDDLPQNIYNSSLAGFIGSFTVKINPIRSGGKRDLKLQTTFIERYSCVYL